MYCMHFHVFHVRHKHVSALRTHFPPDTINTETSHRKFFSAWENCRSGGTQVKSGKITQVTLLLGWAWRLHIFVEFESINQAGSIYRRMVSCCIMGSVESRALRVLRA